MSVFKVNLNNVQQGLLDVDMVTGQQNSTSYQRQAYIMGPKKINRLLKDGMTFTDCNYWKQFAFPQTSWDRAFIQVLTDDGSVYSDIAEENTFAWGATWTLATSYNGTNKIDFVATYGEPAQFLQITNNDGTNAVIGELNGNTSVTFTLPANQTQVFNSGDLAITAIRMKSAASTPNVTLIAGIRNVPQS